MGPQTWPATHTPHPNFDNSKHYAINQSTTSLTLVGNDARGAASPCTVQLGGTGHGGLAVGALVVRVAHACTRRGARAAARAAARKRGGEGGGGERGNDGRYMTSRATAVNKMLPQSKLHQPHTPHKYMHSHTRVHTQTRTKPHANTNMHNVTIRTHVPSSHTPLRTRLCGFPKTITNTS